MTATMMGITSGGGNQTRKRGTSRGDARLVRYGRGLHGQTSSAPLPERDALVDVALHPGNLAGIDRVEAAGVIEADYVAVVVEDDRRAADLVAADIDGRVEGVVRADNERIAAEDIDLDQWTAAVADHVPVRQLDYG